MGTVSVKRWGLSGLSGLTARLQESNASHAAAGSQVLIPIEAVRRGLLSVAWQVGADVVVVTTFFDTSSRTLLALAPGNWMAVTQTVDVSLVDGDTQRVRKASSEQGFFIRLQSSEEVQSLVCAFWDEEQGAWSTEGVRLASQMHLDDMGLEGTWCVSSHLSIFAAFLDLLLDCTNANVLSENSLREILRRAWWSRLPSVSLWILVLHLLALICLACRMDSITHATGLWRDEYFLTQASPVRASCCRPANLREDMMEAKRLVGEARHFRSEDILEEATHLREKVSHMSAQLQPSWRSRMQDLVICQNTLRCLTLQHKVHIHTLAEHFWGPNGWVQGSLAAQNSEPLRHLLRALEDEVPKAFVSVHSSRLLRLWCTLRAALPAHELLMCDLHLTAAKRAKLFMDGILGSLAFVALFFSIDGSVLAARSPEACPLEQGSLAYYIFVAFFSILLNFVPLSFMSSLAWRDFEQEGLRKRQLLKRRLRDVGFWMVSATLSCFHLLLIVAFLANLREPEEWKWMLCLLFVLVRKLLLVPLVSFILSSLASELVLLALPLLTTEPPRKLGVEVQQSLLPTETSVWQRKVEELGLRGIRVRHLLDFYADLQHLMPHFDHELSTTHDVVRQAIIPSTLKLRNPLDLRLQILTDYVNYGSISCAVHAVHGAAKPWKGGGCMRSHEDIFILQDMQGESIHLMLGDATEVLTIFAGLRSKQHGQLMLGDAQLSIFIESLEGDELSGLEKVGQGYSYASAVNSGRPLLAQKMVTHNWGNKFSHLIAAILADALQEETYSGIVQLLKNHDFQRPPGV